MWLIDQLYINLGLTGFFLFFFDIEQKGQIFCQKIEIRNNVVYGWAIHYSRSRSVENVHEFIRWAKHGKTDTVRRIALKWKQEARKNSLRRFSFIPNNI